jgi:hypothetical protein
MMTDRIVESMPQLLRAVSDSSVTRIRLDLPLLALTEQRAWEQQINQHLDECGCREGELGLITGLAGAAAIITTWPRLRGRRAGSVLVLFAGLIGAANGKSAGQRRGRRRAKNLAAN